ncbi:MAG: heavy metal translocating P-type ATPase [Lachnospiraceae bacterium]|nr:heavy metal translocating P-type ATPase [Lachnospiraceae bacterium]
MRFIIKHDGKARIRVHVLTREMTCEQADILAYYFEKLAYVDKVKVYEKSADIAISYIGDKNQVIQALQEFSYQKAEVPDAMLANSGRQMNEEYKEKLIMTVLMHYGKQYFLPRPVRIALTAVKACKYIWAGMKTLLAGKLEVPVLDATAIGVSVLRGDIATAGSIMFLLRIGEILEEWTHKKSVGDLARSMSLQTKKVWLVTDDNAELLVPASQIQRQDRVKVHMGNVIPFDGEVVDGEAMINQSSLTGESLAVRKSVGTSVYAGTVLEEGELTIRVRQLAGSSRYEKIVTMIEESEKLKSGAESKAEHLADRLVPYSLLGTILTYCITRNATKALAILMVDFSCALKLAMPVTVLSAIREAGSHSITVKGGKYLEAMAEADTIVFDKTGTLTKARPSVVKVIPFDGQSEEELLRVAACLEEHFPHSMATAVVEAAKERGLSHEEMHTKVAYIVAHGIATTIDGKRAVIGSRHFVMEDEKCTVSEEMLSTYHHLPKEYSHLYLAIEGRLVAVICIEDPLREEAREVIRALKAAGIKKAVMMTGDNERTASAVAAQVGVDEYYAEVLPEDKAKYVELEKQKGRKVIMIGDGINDSLALSQADVGIAISDGAEIAREIADVTIAAEDLYEIVTLKRLSNAMMHKISRNYRVIVGFNSGLIALGVAGVMQPTTSALLHNTSTIAISLEGMKNLL